jgi:hypothetical protein
MVSSIQMEKTAAKASFVLSPPLSASDYDVDYISYNDDDDDDDDDNDKGGGTAGRAQQTRQARTESSPLSAHSSYTQAPSVPSAASSFTSDYKQDLLVPAETPQPPGDGGQDGGQGGGIKRACSLIKASRQETLALPKSASVSWQAVQLSPADFSELYRRLKPDDLNYFENRLR